VRPVVCDGAAEPDSMNDDRQRGSHEGFLSRWSRRKAVVREGGKVHAEPVASPDGAERERAAGADAAPVDGAVASSALEQTELERAELERTDLERAELERAELERPEVPSAEMSRAEGVYAGVDHERATGPGEGAAVAQPARATRRSPKERPGLTIEDVVKLTRESDYSPFVASDVDPAVSNAAMRKLFSDPQFNVMDGLDVYIDDYTKFEPMPKSMIRTMVVARALGLLDDELAEQPRPEGFERSAEGPDGQALAQEVPVDAASTESNEPMAPNDHELQLAIEPEIDPAIEGAIEGTIDPTSAPEVIEPTPSIANVVDNQDSHEDAHLQLQSHDAAGRAGLDEGADIDDGSRGDGKRPRV
jgi:hypothetical protein